MKLDKLIISFLASLVMLLCFATQSIAKEKICKTVKPTCVTEKCTDPSNSDIIIVDPLASKIRGRGMIDNHQDFFAMAVLVYGTKVNSFSTVQLYHKNLHILFRQLLL